MKYENIMTWNLRDNLFGNLRGPVYDALDEADIQTVGDLVLKTEDEVYRIPGVGAISVHYLKDSLKDYNLKFGWTKEEHEKAILTGLKNPNEIDNVQFSFSKKGENNHFEYEFEFISNSFSVKKQTFSDSDFLNDFFDALNELLLKMKSEKEFYDLIGTTKILLDKYQINKLKNLYRININ